MIRPYFGSVVHVEGMDLAGKSSLTARLGAVYGAEMRRNSLVAENSVYELADGLRRSRAVTPSVLGSLYVAALAYDLDHLCLPTGTQVQDSTIVLRSLAFNEVIGARTVVRSLLELLARHPRYALSVVLTASIDARRRRLDERRATAPEEVAADDLMVETAPGLSVEMEQSLRGYAVRYFDAVVVDTSELSKAQVFRQVAALASAAGVR